MREGRNYLLVELGEVVLGSGECYQYSCFFEDRKKRWALTSPGWSPRCLLETCWWLCVDVFNALELEATVIVLLCCLAKNKLAVDEQLGKLEMTEVD